MKKLLFVFLACYTAHSFAQSFQYEPKIFEFNKATNQITAEFSVFSLHSSFTIDALKQYLSQIGDISSVSINTQTDKRGMWNCKITYAATVSMDVLRNIFEQKQYRLSIRSYQIDDLKIRENLIYMENQTRDSLRLLTPVH
jgi:hypothetical protein